MIKRIILFLLISVLILCAGAISIYIINPFGVKSENIRPRLFGFDIYRIPSKSMQPLLYPGDYVSVSNTAYLNELPQRNDVVVFYKPGTKRSDPRIPYIKRIVAIAGDTVEIINARVIVNDKKIEESYVLDENIKSSYSLKMRMTTIPENHVFVLGDNRDNSSDSRMYGTVLKDDVIAKASSILYGINERSGKEIK